jgi:uncharacterized cupredoxin-like copper-binding protein
MRTTWVVLVVGAALLAGVAPATEARPARATVKVMLDEWTLVPSTRRVAAGRVTFVVRNAGKVEHELVIARTNRPHGALPVKGAVAVVKKAAETGGIAPGATRRLTVRLARGNYVLLCNLPGHYRAGQHAALRVG